MGCLARRNRGVEMPPAFFNFSLTSKMKRLLFLVGLLFLLTTFTPNIQPPKQEVELIQSSISDQVQKKNLDMENRYSYSLNINHSHLKKHLDDIYSKQAITYNFFGKRETNHLCINKMDSS